MSEAVAHVAPFHDPSRKSRLVKVAGWLVGTAVVVFVLDLLGVDVIGWLQDLWDQIKAIPAGYIVAALVFQTGQTLLAGLSYYGILRAAYPGQVEFWPIVTAYAVGVAMNNFLPANIGTFVTLVMFVAIIPAATFPGAIAAYLVQKIFFTIAGTFVYLYLFLSVPGSFDENLGNISENPVTTILIAVGGAFLIVVLGRDLLGAGEEALGEGEAGRRDPLPPEAVLSARVPALAPLLALQAGRDRDLPGGVRDPGHVRVDHVGDRLGLARQRRLGHAGRRRDHAGDERARARHLLRRRQGRRGRLLHRAAADHDRVERPRRDRAGRLGLRLDGRQAARRGVVRRREGQGRRAEGTARREEGGEESGARGVRSGPVPSSPRRRRRGDAPASEPGGGEPDV